MGKVEMERVRAVERYRRGESAAAIGASIGRSVRWVYKWVERAEQGGQWWREQSRTPRRVVNRSPADVEQLIVDARRRLVRDGGFAGAQMIAWELEESAVAVPSIATINRVLKRHGLIERDGRRRVSKGKKYPAPEAFGAGVHQSDFVGPRYLHGPVRFYSLNTVDVATGRCATVPIPDRSTEVVVPALWDTWVRLGIPRIQQLDNELVFFGSRRHPRGLSQVLRLCLMHGVEPLFIPPAEPWRNGVVEKFNDLWQQKFLRHPMATFAEVCARSRAFDERHNSRWRYRKIGGRTPNEALATSGVTPPAPPQIAPPALPLPRPVRGRYHFIRFIRSDRVLDLFGERFVMPAGAAHEYVQATVDIEKQQLQVLVDQQVIETIEYASPQ